MKLVITWMLVGGSCAVLAWVVAANWIKTAQRNRALRDRQRLRDMRSTLRQAIEERMKFMEKNKLEEL